MNCNGFKASGSLIVEKQVGSGTENNLVRNAQKKWTGHGVVHIDNPVLGKLWQEEWQQFGPAWAAEWGGVLGGGMKIPI